MLFYNSDAENSEASSQKPIEEKAVIPSPEQVFAECSQKRILGLLAAMLPPLNSVRDKMAFKKEREKVNKKRERVHERVVLCIEKIFGKPYTEMLIAIICISLG